MKEKFFFFQNGIMGVLRVLIALENTLGSLAPQVNALMARVMALENEKNGSSNRLLENPVCPIFRLLVFLFSLCTSNNIFSVI